MSTANEVFEYPLEVLVDQDNLCFEIYDRNRDRVASDIEELEQAKMFAAAPEMYHALELECICCKLRDHETDCSHCAIGEALRKARGKA